MVLAVIFQFMPKDLLFSISTAAISLNPLSARNRCRSFGNGKGSRVCFRRPRI